MAFNTFFVLDLFMLFLYILPLHKMVRPSSSGCLSKLFLYFPFYIWCFVHTTYQYIVIESMGIITQGKNGQKLGHCDQLKVSRWGDPKIMKINQRDVSLWQRQRSRKGVYLYHWTRGERCLSKDEDKDTGHQWRKPWSSGGKLTWTRKWWAGSKIVLHDKVREIFAIDRRTNRNKRSFEGRDYKVL